VKDTITWILTKIEQYAAKYAYKAQFYGATSSLTRSSVWKTWATQKSNPLLGWSYEIEFLPSTGYKRGVGQIAWFAHFAIEYPSRLDTAIVGTP
jgi:hypothetical protein